MFNLTLPLSPVPKRKMMATALASALLLGSSAVSADEADAKRLLKAMSDYLSSQNAFSFDYDAMLEIVTPEEQVLGLASSGQVMVNRPNKVNASRSGGFADAELNFDGKTLTLLGKNLNTYTQVEIPGDINHLIHELRDTYNRPLPAADLLGTDSYDVLMENVTDIKDLGSGVIGGVECDSLAFRTDEVDWQIWISQGSEPYPCRYVITTKLLAGAPQYSVEVRNWKSGSEATRSDFSFKNSTDAKNVKLEDLKGTGDLPEIYNIVDGETE